MQKASPSPVPTETQVASLSPVEIRGILQSQAQTIDALKHQLEWFKRQMFGTKSERLAVLEELIDRMRREAAHQDWVETSKADLEFHRQICLASDNEIVITLWEALARHVMIVFGFEIRDERDGPRLAQQHGKILRLLRQGDLARLDREIERHILRLRDRRKSRAA